MTDGFNFKLGRMRMNVERKREFVRKHADELEKMEVELRMTCPHESKNITVVDTQVELTDFYNRVRDVRTYACAVCGTTLRSVVLPIAQDSIVHNNYH